MEDSTDNSSEFFLRLFWKNLSLLCGTTFFFKIRFPVSLTTNNFMSCSRCVRLAAWMSSHIELKSQDTTAGYLLKEKEKVLGGKNKT